MGKDQFNERGNVVVIQDDQINQPDSAVRSSGKNDGVNHSTSRHKNESKVINRRSFNATGQQEATNLNISDAGREADELIQDNQMFVLRQNLPNLACQEGHEQTSPEKQQNNSLVQVPVHQEVQGATVEGEELGKTDLDIEEESTAQNFNKVARHGDISPRQIEKRKSAGKLRNKHQRNTSAPPGVQTRRTTSKSNVQ